VAITLQLWPEGIEPEYGEYQGALPAGLTFDSSRTETRLKLGVPEKSNDGAPGEGILGGYFYPWDRFQVGQSTIHFEYDANYSTIRLVSISLV
jgi:hypothetical protein